MTCCVHMWHLMPGPVTLQALPLCFKPTDLQLSVHHPKLIDLVPYPGLRDQLIHHYRDDSRLDLVYLDLIQRFVINISDISAIVAGADSGPGFMGVCNIFDAMSGGRATKPVRPIYTQDSVELYDNSLLGLLQAHKMPTPNTSQVGKSMCEPGHDWVPVSLVEILSSPVIAQRLYHHLNLYMAHEKWRVDPEFYETYPDLRWDGYEQTVAVGTSYRVASEWFQQTALDPIHS